MEQRDYILREIEKIHVVLQAILGKIMGGNTDIPNVNEDFEQLNKQLVEDTRVDIKELLRSDNKPFDRVFKKAYGYNESNIELFADMLAEMAKKAEGNMKNQLNQKALETYQYVDGVSNSFSFNRKSKIDTLKRKLELNH
ncbi:MAG: hypothetical protein ACLFM7_09570 [Bacteroidales bacterium]